MVRKMQRIFEEKSSAIINELREAQTQEQAYVSKIRSLQSQCEEQHTKLRQRKDKKRALKK